MKTIKIAVVSVILAFTSCQGDVQDDSKKDGGSGSEEVARLKSELENLKLQMSDKDSTINQSVRLFNEIQDNLISINLKEDEIRIKSRDVELSEDSKNWIIEEIKKLNMLREENARKASQLRKLTSNLKKENNELIAMRDNLLKQIEEKDKEIERLRNELADMDREYLELFDAYQEQVELAYETMLELNEAYYAYGTVNELRDNNVIEKNGAFYTLKTIKIKSDLNEEYFTKVDITKVKEIPFEGKKYEIITEHPTDSYQVVETDNGHKLVITNYKKFWKISKFLVIGIK
ncbi:MAG: hypothetical protein R2799_02800 [Crocinitomicaceae bacterium]